MTEQASTIYKKHNLLVFLGLLGLNTFLFWETLFVGFLSDDFHALWIARENPHIWNFFTTNIIGTRVGSSYGPLWNVVIWLQYHLFGLNPLGYHVVSILLFTGAGYVLYRFVEALTRQRGAALFAALVFSFLPGHSEAVAWISVQVHLLASLLFVAALFFYYRYAHKRHRKDYYVSLVLITCSLLTKEVGLTFIVLFPLTDLIIHRKSLEWKQRYRQIAKDMVMPALIFCMYLLLRGYATGTVAGYYASDSLGLQIGPLFSMSIELFLSFFLSSPLRGEVLSILTAVPIITIVVGIGLLSALVVQYKERKIALMAIAWYIIASAPFLFLAFSSVSNEGERYGYLLSFFFCILVGLLYTTIQLKETKQAFFVAAVLLAFVGGASLMQKNLNWVRASRIADSIVTDFSHMVFEQDTVVWLMGLPDSYNGVQVLRNGIREAVSLKTGAPLPPVERMYILTRLYDESPLDVMIVQKDALTYEMTANNERAFTGFPTIEHARATITLEDFSLVDHSGSGVLIDGNAQALETQEQESIQIVYYTNGSLEQMTLFSQ